MISESAYSAMSESKYKPHQGEQERARRRKQRERENG